MENKEIKLAIVGDLVVKSMGISVGTRGIVTNVIVNFTGTTIYEVNTPMGLLSWYSRHVRIIR